MSKFLFFDDKIMNIMVKQEKPSGGAAVQSYGWIRGLLEAGQEVNVLTHATENQVLKEECIDIKLVPLYNATRGVKWVRWFYYRLPYLYRVMKTNKPDYFYESVPCWKSFLFGLICRHLHIKYILRISNDCFMDKRAYKSRSPMELFFQNWGMKLSYCILCQNNYQFTIARTQFPGKRIFKITNPLLLNEKPQPEISKQRNYIAWLGLFQYQKNIRLLYEIACSLKQEKIVVAGKQHTDCDPETKYYLNKLARLPNVEFIGFLERDKISGFFAGAKFLLNTSHYEGFSNTFLEAMSANTPIITSAHVNPDDIISRYNLGIVYKDRADLERQFNELNPETLQNFNTNLARYIGQHDYRLLSKRLLTMLDDTY